ncbi:universal bacterial protein YeaZ [Clostridiales bacterium 1_7_47FAA]|uniref:tRNA (Adenosine(37)-N6)-threonylcarbamoyltransferase complex dimerization subunit type 1 TsaB n=1 Tax=Enterocloster hominis (ex Hitch et al. 2024) TaxID=1917870 RepID=A0ABV1DCQ3_9FIRM|nr:tRNA (adenosine(37)-N6)-threonylcarbamoyltransferase complex dimerization subunit type 1 TsaB [Lachnoclostridium pacaense]EEQ62259.1 universal bacterial protein YeaZ [Clostridiales bacterium 1_7_47FAA]MCC2820896.1 tRNA (adenosine(37)-N6)-threonylcarbamoyltransferase complex dimerization subunit type 1 TsaB [Lachnoclostridium pacaense]
MRVLGIESSSLVASVALVTDDIMTAEYTVDFKKTHSQTLLPMLDEIVKLLELDLDTIDAIAVAGGPGSFTGLRIGAATAKGLGLALKKPLVHVPTVDAMAYNMWGTSGLVCPIMDAKRSQVYTGLYHVEDGLKVLMEQCPMDMRELARLLNERGERVIFLGDGVPVYRSIIEEEMQVSYGFAPAQMNRQRASCVAVLGMTALLDAGSGSGAGVGTGAGAVIGAGTGAGAVTGAGDYHGARLVSAADFAPDYLRKPQAERQREAELSAKGAAAKLPGDY